MNTQWRCGCMSTITEHYGDVMMGAIASQITSLTIVFSAVYSDADQRKHQSSALLAFVWGIHRGPVNSPHKRPVTRKLFPFDDVIMKLTEYRCVWPYGAVWHIECSSSRIVQVWTQHISPTTIRAPTNLQIYLKDRLSQVSVQWGYCLVWMMHTTLSITQLYKSPIRANRTPYC